jgi:ATP synthase protein I
MTDDKMKKDSTFFEIDKEGNLKRGQKKEKGTQNKNRQIDPNALNIGYYLITPIIIGVILGLLIDNWMKTKPLFTIVLIFLGMAASIYNLFKLVKNA